MSVDRAKNINQTVAANRERTKGGHQPKVYYSIKAAAEKRRIEEEKERSAKKQKKDEDEDVEDDTSDEDDDDPVSRDNNRVKNNEVADGLLTFAYVDQIKRCRGETPPGDVLKLNIKNVPWMYSEYESELKKFRQHFSEGEPVWADIGAYGIFFVESEVDLKHLVKFILDWNAANPLSPETECPKFGKFVKTHVSYRFTEDKD